MILAVHTIRYILMVNRDFVILQLVDTCYHQDDVVGQKHVYHCSANATADGCVLLPLFVETEFYLVTENIN